MKPVLILALAALAAAAGGYAWYQRHPAGSAPALSGNVDIREVNLSFRVGGRLARLAVDEGDRVHAGDLLGELDAEPLRIALADARASRAALEARRALYRRGYRQEDIDQARATVAAREAARHNAEQVFGRQAELAGSGASSQRALDDALSQRDQARAQEEAARAQLQALERGFRREEIAEADANAQRADAQLRQAQLQLADARLLAPADGTVLTRAVEPGTLLVPGATVLTLSLDRPVWVRAYAAEDELGLVVPGRHVQVTADGNAHAYDGVIGFVSPAAEFTPKSVETRDLRTALVYRLRIIIQDADARLRQGMPVTVTLQPGR